ncbi:VOC family protein [Kribbella sp. NPDC058245]|uniref:VOC family protein n=1 Tax=Kribbella sp. NPDC058245 TaxID=3346399 RepID=UPI0036EA7EAB
MADHVVHFEIIGTDPASLQTYYAELFGWQYTAGSAVPAAAYEGGGYGFIGSEVAGLNGGVGGGPLLQPKVLFYIGVDDVTAALERAEKLGGTPVFGPEGDPGQLVVARFTDPEGNLIGLAGPK